MQCPARRRDGTLTRDHRGQYGHPPQVGDAEETHALVMAGARTVRAFAPDPPVRRVHVAVEQADAGAPIRPAPAGPLAGHRHPRALLRQSRRCPVPRSRWCLSRREGEGTLRRAQSLRRQSPHLTSRGLRVRQGRDPQADLSLLEAQWYAQGPRQLGSIYRPRRARRSRLQP